MSQSNTIPMGRRNVLGALGMMALPGCAVAAAPSQSAGTADCPSSSAKPQFVDLTHRLTAAFAIGSPPRISHEAVDGSGKDHGMLLNRFSLVEHTGTHIDAPSHFGADRADLSQLPLDDLIGPLAVLDMREQASSTVNFSVLPSHIMEWEAQHGELPDGGCLALLSGFDPISAMERMRAGGGRPPNGMPGFAPESAEWLLANRNLKGIAVDSMTLDSGAYTPEYPFHNAWLKEKRWGIEAIANLDAVPATGATIIVGAAPIGGATGFPVRAIAML